MIPEKLNKPYSPKETETAIYEKWEKGGYFKPENGSNTTQEIFSIVLPPPNVTGSLHTGHAAMLAIEDVLVRYNRMKGLKTLWIPGTDHAAIATQSRVENDIYKKDKKTRYDLGREEMLRRINEFADQSHDRIVSQIRKMGASVDWDREAYTLDDKRSIAVQTAFKKMYDGGLIYRGNRIVNWDPKLQTTISDDELVYEEQSTKLYTFKYGKDFPISISTTRPETKLGDTGVAVHPDDKRYKEFVGKTYEVDFCGEKLNIKVVADSEVDPEFGTGAIGVTPAHSMVDFDIAERHGLDVKQVINESGKLTVGIGGVKDKRTKTAREEVAKWIEKEKLMEKVENISNSISLSERSGAVIEPLPKLQWFVNVNKKFTLPNSNLNGIKSGEMTTLKEIMKKVVESRQIEIIPDRFNKTYFQWIDNLRDWCISRQIWFGHRIPVWYHEPKCVPIKGREKDVANCIDIIVSDIEPACKHCDSKYTQDPDTLDTWFSSGLWTFSTLGWPEDTSGLATFHPTTVLETGYDILFFWVARMILMSGYHLGDIPFKYVYIHGLVRDEKGKKMSKSLGNIVDPIDYIDKFGADALRMSLIVGAPPGNDMSLGEHKIKAYKHFANKIWNASRFVMMTIDGIDLNKEPKLTDTDKKYLEELDNLSKEVSSDLDNFKLYLAAERLYHYFWHTFADKIIEGAKARISKMRADERDSVCYTLNKILITNLILLHPFMPFITEELWSIVSKSDKPLITSEWPSHG